MPINSFIELLECGERICLAFTHHLSVEWPRTENL
jgi:hypothetical protein